MREDYDKSANRPRMAVLTTDGFQDAEAYMPIGYLTNKGVDIKVIGPESGRVKAYNNDIDILIDNSIDEVSIDEFDLLLIPGGHAPTKLKENKQVVQFVRDFFNSGKIVAAICHGPQVLAKAGVLEGKTITGVSKIQEELEAVGAVFKDEPLVIDGNLITSRVPVDLPMFVKALEKALV